MTAEVLPDQGYHTAMVNQRNSDKALLQWDTEQDGPYVMSLEMQPNNLHWDAAWNCLCYGTVYNIKYGIHMKCTVSSIFQGLSYGPW